MGDDSNSEGPFQSLDPRRQEEFNSYFEAHKRGLLYRAMTMLKASGLYRTQEELGDVARYCVQEAFIKLAKAMREETKPFSADSGGPQHVKDWLYEVTKNFVMMEQRSTHPLPQVSLDALYIAQGSDTDRDDPLADNAHLNDLMSRLNPIERTILELKIRGYRSKEIVAILKNMNIQMTEDAVRQQMRRALKKLKKWHNRE